MLLGFCDSGAYQVRATCGRRIGMCGYTSVPEDGRICVNGLICSPLAAEDAVDRIAYVQMLSFLQYTAYRIESVLI